MAEEVRYHMLRPHQIVERRRAFPVAYLPIGTLEWHGVHNAVGADTLQAEGLAILAARKGGGLVFPPLYYGECRTEGIMEANAADREQIAEAMELAPENFSPQRFPFGVMEQYRNYQALLLHILAEMQSLGFKVGVIVAGHYPLIDHARAACLLFNQRSKRTDGGMLAWACIDYTLVADRWPRGGDHAGGWETSHMMALHPQTVDLTSLPPEGQPLVGVGWRMLPPQQATSQLGQETLEAAADVIVREVRHRLENPKMYSRHGYTMLEGLWRQEDK